MIDAALLERIPPARMVSMEREIFPALIAAGIPAYGWIPEAYWRDIGSPAAYRAAQVDLLDGRVRTTLRPSGTAVNGTWMGPGGRRADDAEVRGPAVIGADVVLERGAVVGAYSVIGDGATIGPDARVEGAILWRGVQVGAAAVLRGCVVGAEARIGAHARVGASTVLAAGAEVPAHRVLD
jgi:NDP-sugar pyrophosphorylase family protein